MKATIIGAVNEVKTFTKEDLEKAKTFSGKNAGICYMQDSYFNSDVSDNDKATARFSHVAGINHHSIADHVRIEVLFEGISKMLAIVLNSLQDYSTSEKSGRYTVMTGNSAEETKLYDKWMRIFKSKIIETYPSIDDDILSSKLNKKYPDNGYIIKNGRKMEVSPNLSVELDKEANNYWLRLLDDSNLPSNKLAQENARYVLSVFTRSTTMGYSTSLRQWNYIYDWCIKYMNQYYFNEDNILYCKDSTCEASYFEKELYTDFKKLSEFIYDSLYVDVLRDTKDRCFDFLTSLSGDKNHPMSRYHIVEPDFFSNEVLEESQDDKLDISYSVSYMASFVHIAQAERHRTLKYFMQFNPYCPYPIFFIPPVIRGTSYEKEWLEDLESIAHLVPQAVQVGIIETGHIGDFVLKCKERLCGRAQWEIMTQTKETAERFLRVSSPSRVLQVYIDKIKNSDSVKTKCQLIGSCKESCNWMKINEVFSRKI